MMDMNDLVMALEKAHMSSSIDLDKLADILAKKKEEEEKPKMLSPLRYRSLPTDKEVDMLLDGANNTVNVRNRFSPWAYPIDLQTKHGNALFESGCKPLAKTYKGEVENLQTFVNNMTERAKLTHMDKSLMLIHIKDSQEKPCFFA